MTTPPQEAGNGECQPPRNRITASPQTTNMAAYSAKKNNAQRNPEYSVRKPATSSLSASGKSKGARLQLASEAMK